MEKKIVYMEVAFYVDSTNEGHDKMEAITNAIDDVMDCKHAAPDSPDYDENAPCNMVSMWGHIMGEAEYDAWLDERFPHLAPEAPDKL